MTRPYVPPSQVKSTFETFPGLQNILNEKDQQLYPGSVVRSWQKMAQPGGKPDALAKAVSDCVAVYNPTLRSHESSLLIPLSSLTTRALDTQSGSTGAYLVGSQVSQEVARVLRANSVCVAAGARVLTGLRDNFSIGLERSEVTFSWLHQSDVVTQTDSTFGTVALTPHRLAGLTAISKELKFFSYVDVQGFVIDSLSRGLGVAVDRAALVGSGALGEPLGVYNLPSPLTVTFGGASTLAKSVDFQTQILNNKGRVEDIAYVAPPNVRAKWQTVQEFSGSSFGLWRFDETIAGRPAYTTTSMPAASIMSGDFSSLVIGFFGDALETIVDPYAQKKNAVIEILCTTYADVATAYPQLWVVNADSALQ